MTNFYTYKILLRYCIACSFAFLMFVGQLHATHNRAGEITYRFISPLTFEVTITTYTDARSLPADRDSLEIMWGDNTSEFLRRMNGPDIFPNNGIPDGENQGNFIKMNRYVGVHQYPGVADYYVINVMDPNRIDNIVNINNGNSVNIPFFLEDTLKMYPIQSVGQNSSPVLINPPIDFANVGDTFYHNPNAFDPDGDSIHFSLVEPLQFPGTPVPNYAYPDEIIPGANNTFKIDARTGEIIWAVPQQKGIYNIAILIREFRDGLCMGVLIRDMEIFVGCEENDPPQITEARDTCVIAGDTLVLRVSATDPNVGDQVTLTAAGGPFAVGVNPASFSAVNGNPASGIFNWNTACEHIRPQFYQVVFKAEDDHQPPNSPDPLPLVDLESWIIEVIAPAPDSPQAVAVSDVITVSWLDPYTCADFDKFIGFSLWRRLGSNPFEPDPCETGLVGRGYTQIANQLTDYTYEDSDVERGHTYCYRIVAHFASRTPNGTLFNQVESRSSDEVCVELARDVPVITHASVLQTDLAAGQVFIDWTKPKAGAGNLDTLQNPGPYRYDLYRSTGFNQANDLIVSFTSPTYSGLNDTSFIDNQINTVNAPNAYRVEFFANGNDLIGESEIASTVFLELAASDRQIALNWNENVPWTNTSYSIFRESPFNPGIFDSITTVPAQNYLDTGLINDSNYCYFVRSNGGYSTTGIVNPIINLSQQVCARPIDTVPPCVPELLVVNDCEDVADQPWSDANFVNDLWWNRPNASCFDDAVAINIYFQGATEENFALVHTVSDVNDTSWSHALVDSESGLAGCYQITAVDLNGNESRPGNVACVDNCPFYDLPNVFTPNGDGSNDVYTPFLPYRFVTEIEMSIYNRWGNLVFETTDPDILWDGTDQKTGKKLSDGVYFYSGFLYEERVDGRVKRPLPPNEKGGGFIHLITNSK